MRYNYSGHTKVNYNTEANAKVSSRSIMWLCTVLYIIMTLNMKAGWYFDPY